MAMAGYNIRILCDQWPIFLEKEYISPSHPSPDLECRIFVEPGVANLTLNLVVVAFSNRISSLSRSSK